VAAPPCQLLYSQKINFYLQYSRLSILSLEPLVLDHKLGQWVKYVLYSKQSPAGGGEGKDMKKFVCVSNQQVRFYGSSEI
jgi:hypothetical protein